MRTRRSRGVTSSSRDPLYLEEHRAPTSSTIDGLLALLEPQRDEDNRPAKRRKVGTEDHQLESVTINKSSIYLISNISADKRVADRIQHTAVQDLVGIRISKAQDNAGHTSKADDNQVVHILPLGKVSSTKTPAAFATAPSQGQTISQDARLALEIASTVDHRSNPAGRGRLWTQIDLTLEPCAGENEFMQQVIRLDLMIKINITESLEWVPQISTRHPKLATVIQRYFSKAKNVREKTTWTPQDFYLNTHIPTKSDDDESILTLDILETELFPFQKRAVKWLLQREGVYWSTSRKLKALDHASSAHDVPYSFRYIPGACLAHEKPISARKHITTTVTNSSDGFFWSDLFMIAAKNLNHFRHVVELKGGILAEEMGLGKTVEMTALISLHTRDMHRAILEEYRDLYSKELVKSIKTTLIITPPSILQQWMKELNRHAPNLKVMHYQGIKSYAGAMTSESLLETMSRCDVVLTTYGVLSSEIHYTKLPPDRSMRRAPVRPRAKSPLVLASWWRVCLDEAQMVESGVSNAAQVARLIPRVNAWGVTGTPIRKDVSDLLGLLCFLRLEPYATLRYYWDSLISFHKDSFKELFGQIAMRHTKHIVRHELKLPGQQRYVITLPFTPIEEQYYKSLFEQMCEEVGVDTKGAPLQDDWDPEASMVIESMRAWLQRLRQTVLHPEVGGRNRRALGTKGGPLRTVEEVLEVMLEQSEISIRARQRDLLISKLKRGQYYENSPRVQEALDLWTEVRNHAAELVADSRQQLALEIRRLQRSGKLKASDDSGDGSSADDGADLGSEQRKRLGVFKNRLRAVLEVEHMAVFFQTNAYFQIKSNEEMTGKNSEDFKSLQKLEDDGYELAKSIRKEILQEISQRASRYMSKLSMVAAMQSFVELPTVPEITLKGGIESRGIVGRLNSLGEALDAQANQFDEWREEVIQLLLKPLVDEEDEVDLTGDEYENSTKTQDTMVALITALRTVIEDRHEALTGQPNILINGEAKAALRLAEGGEGPAPERLIELLKARDEIKPLHELGSLRAVAAELRNSLLSLNVDSDDGNVRARNEYALLDKGRTKVNAILQDQTKAVERLRQEIELLTRGMNIRLEFYRQLQQVSDMVAPLEEPDWKIHDRYLIDEDKFSKRISADQIRRRYLLHLQSDTGDEVRKCVICLDQIETGSLTICGHQFCKDCMLHWWRHHKTCPTCKQKLKLADLQDISYKAKKAKVAEEVVTTAAPASSSTKSTPIYSQIANRTLLAIQDIELPGQSFGTKIDTIARHIIWLRESDPGAKSIIFSQFKDFLDVLVRALRSFRIGHSSIDRFGGIQAFKEDPAIECFLLHGKAQSSGLNLVVASHVFLCEPLINTALELQAIARVDRIGQQQKTSVYLYLVQDTVEEAIYEISVKRRMAHLGSIEGESKEDVNVLEGTIEDANSAELQTANIAAMVVKGKGGGEFVDKEDLWSCLFGNANKQDTSMRVGAEVDETLRGHLAAEAAEARASTFASQ